MKKVSALFLVLFGVCLMCNPFSIFAQQAARKKTRTKKIRRKKAVRKQKLRASVSKRVESQVKMLGNDEALRRLFRSQSGPIKPVVETSEKTVNETILRYIEEYGEDQVVRLLRGEKVALKPQSLIGQKNEDRSELPVTFEKENPQNEKKAVPQKVPESEISPQVKIVKQEKKGPEKLHQEVVEKQPIEVAIEQLISATALAKNIQDLVAGFKKLKTVKNLVNKDIYVAEVERIFDWVIIDIDRLQQITENFFEKKGDELPFWSSVISLINEYHDVLIPPVMTQKMPSEVEKDASDAIFMSGLHQIATEMIGTELEMSGSSITRIGTERSYKKQFLSPLEAYIFLMQDVLIYNVGRHEEFKNRSVLRQILGLQESNILQLDSFIKENCIKDSDQKLFSFLEKQYANITEQQTLLQQFKMILGSCLFNLQNRDQKGFLKDIETILISTIAKQRVKTAISEKNKTESDLVLYNVFKQIKKNVEDESVPFSKDYVDELSKTLNRFRIHPLFIPFDGMIGNGLMRLYISEKNDIEKLQKRPLLDALWDRDPKNFTVSKAKFLYEALKRLFFDTDALEEIMPSAGNVWKLLLEDHAHRLEAEKAAEKAAIKYPIIDLIQKFFKRSKKEISILNLIGMFESIKQVAPDRSPLIDALKSAISEVMPDFEKIEKLFYQLPEKEAPRLSPQIIEQLKSLIKETAQRAQFEEAVISIILKAGEQFRANNGDKPVGSFIVTELKSLSGEGTPLDSVIKRITAELRTAETFFEQLKLLVPEKKLLEAILGNPLRQKEMAVDKWKALHQFYHWIEPYGILYTVIKEWPAAAEKFETATEKLQNLKDIFDALNTGIRKTSSTRKIVYPASITNEKAVSLLYKDENQNLKKEQREYIYNTGVYVSKLGAAMKGLADFDPELIQNEVTDILASAKVISLNKRVISEFITAVYNTMIAELIRQLHSFEKQDIFDVELPLFVQGGAGFEEKVRIKHVYAFIAEKMSKLRNLLITEKAKLGTQKTSSDDSIFAKTDLESFESDLKRWLDEQPEIGIDYYEKILSYWKQFKERLTNLITFAAMQQPKTPIAPAVRQPGAGAPPPPPPPPAGSLSPRKLGTPPPPPPMPPKPKKE